MRLVQRIIEEERLFFFLGVINKFNHSVQEGLCKVFISPKRFFTAAHVTNSADTSYNAHVMAMGRTHIQQFRILIICGDIIKHTFFIICYLYRILRFKIHDSASFYINAGYTICGCRKNKGFIKA